MKKSESVFQTAFYSFIWYLCCCCCRSPEVLWAGKSGSEITLSQAVDWEKWIDVINWAECWRLPGLVPILCCSVLKLASYSVALFMVHAALPGKGISFCPRSQKSSQRDLKSIKINIADPLRQNSKNNRISLFYFKIVSVLFSSRDMQVTQCWANGSDHL